MKKILSILLTAAMILSMMSVPAFAEKITETDGFTEITSATTELTAGTSYKISTAAGLTQFGALVNALSTKVGCTVYLANDIDMAGATWTTMGGTGSSECKFIGTFDGNGFAIKNLVIGGCTDDAGGYQGFINRSASGLAIKNLGLVDCSIAGGGRFVGGLVGRLRTGSTIDNCYFTGSLSSTHTKGEGYPGCGGLVGTVDGGSITNCYGLISSNTATDYSNGGTGVVGHLNSGTASGIYSNVACSSSALTSFVKVYADAATAAGDAPSDLDDNFAYDTNNINNGWPILAWQDTSAVKFGAAAKIPGIQYTVQSGTNQVFITGINDVAYWTEAPETLVIPKTVSTTSENAYIVGGEVGVTYDVTGVTGSSVLAALPTAIKTLVIDADIQTLPEAAFRGTPVETLIITGAMDLSATAGGANAQVFRNNESLKNLIILGNVGLVGYRSFYYCHNLENVVLGDGVRALGDYSFYGAAELASITIPRTVTAVGSLAFAQYNSAMALNTINFEASADAIAANANIDPATFSSTNTVAAGTLTINYGQISDGVIRAAGYQMKTNDTDDGKFDIRFAGILGILDYDKAGFDVKVTSSMVGQKTAKNTETTLVYKSLAAATGDGIESITAEDKGGNYIYAVTIEGMPKTGTFDFEVTPYVIVDGIKVTGTTQTLMIVDGSL